MPIQRDIIYPIFLKTIQYTEDRFWKDTFENLAYSICPNGSYISKGFLCSNIKGQDFVYKFIDKEPQTIYDDITKLLKEKLHIMSRNERLVLLKEFEEGNKRLEYLRKLIAEIQRKLK